MSNNAPQGFMVILGDAYIGETLIARPNGISDADGINYSTTSFQWLSNGQPITGATGQTYDVTSRDVGDEISVEYSYRDSRGNTEVVTSKPKDAVPNGAKPEEVPYIAPSREADTPEAPGNSDPTGWVVALGEPKVGNTLTARPNAVEDADGINTATVRYQWFREDELISGATGQTYVVSSADQGKRISVEYSYTDFGGTREIEYSRPKDAVPYESGSVPKAPVVPTTPTPPAAPTTPVVELPSIPTPAPIAPIVPTAPVDHINSGPVGNVFILGFALEDVQLLARIDALFDRDNIVEGTGAYQWLRDGEPIDGATGKTYTVTAADRGAEISVQYSYTDGAGTRETVESPREAPVPYPEGTEPPRTRVEAEPADEAPVIAQTTPEDDTVTITNGMSSVDGLDGTDTAVLAGNQNDYTVAMGPDGVTVTNRNADGFGTVELTNFEFLDFGTALPIFDGPMDLDAFGGYSDLSAADFAAFAEIYIAYFNRAPDAVGLAFWASAYADGTSLQEIATMFADQPETLATYPADTTNLKFAADVYENVLGRLPDIEGLRFWTEQLETGEVSRGEFIYEVLQGVKAAPEAGSTQEFIDRKAADQAYLDAKTDIGMDFAVTHGMSNVDDAAMVMAMYDGTQGSFDDAVEAIETLYGAAQDPVNGEFLMPLVGITDDAALL